MTIKYDAIKNFLVDTGGTKILSDRIFENCIFHDFTLGASQGETVNLSNVKIINSKVFPGSCKINDSIILENIVFDEFDCGDAMHVSSGVIFNNVKISGKRFPKMLWVKQSIGQEENGVTLDYECDLDVSSFYGDLNIVGLKLTGVERDSSRQIGIKIKLFESVNWKKLDIRRGSYWRLMANRIESSNALEGLISLPDAKSQSYCKSMQELEVLKKYDLVI